MKALGQRSKRRIDKLLRRSSRVYRLATWQDRVLPDFMIIGAQKAGTTSLYSYLAQHPHLFASHRKEVHFFDGGLNPRVNTFRRKERWYRAHFPRAGELGSRGQAFEASPLYLFNPLAPRRIHDLLPGVRLIALLRNPVERAISHYFHERRKGRETLPVMEAMQAEEERLAPVIEAQDYKSDAFRRCSYKSRGIYHRQLKRYLDYFPRENLLVMDSDDLFRRPAQALRRVLDFVGANPAVDVRDLEPRNVGSNRRRVDAAVYEYLEEYFRPHNEILYELLEWDFGW